MQRVRLSFLVPVMVAPLLLGCTKETTDGGDDETETGGDGGVCELESPYICECDVGGEWKALSDWIYDNNPVVADSKCYHACIVQYAEIHSWKVTPVACIEGAREIDCSSWAPATAIMPGDTPDHLYIDRKLIESLIHDPEPLRSCDDAVFARNTLIGGHTVMNSSPGELIFELGLQDGDTVKSINGYPLNSAEDVAIAYTKLWSNGATDLFLSLQRDGASYQYHYTIVD